MELEETSEYGGNQDGRDGDEGEEVPGDGGEGNFGGDFADDLFQPSVERWKLSRAQKRVERHAHGLERAQDQPDSRPLQRAEALAVSAEELQQLQETESDLARLMERGNFFKQNRILYRRWVPRGQPEEAVIEQIVLPKRCRGPVLQLAHSIPLGGHLGKKKTAERIMRRFYWPTIFRDVADFCRSCIQCQKASCRRVTRAPMVSLPLIDEPFQRIAMDVVGPSPRSRSGHRYVLVLCDYATRYPEAAAMKNIDAEAVADELLKVPRQ